MVSIEQQTANVSGFCVVLSGWRYRMYVGESNENLKSALKIRNTVRLSCKLTTVILMVCRVADRRQYAAGM